MSSFVRRKTSSLVCEIGADPEVVALKGSKFQLLVDTFLGWNHLQHTRIAVEIARWNFFKTTKNSSKQIRRLYAYSTFIFTCKFGFPFFKIRFQFSCETNFPGYPLANSHRNFFLWVFTFFVRNFLSFFMHNSGKNHQNSLTVAIF